ncbi:MAG: hypothetical protein HQL48_03185 [Gammaproteobacteria bacterium]|nr:hypothetical protein [Gammaproteobacteria bacterium]
MAIRSFLFCDICNPDAIRVPDYRRNEKRNSRSGRRFTDGRKWVEASREVAATEHGWFYDSNQRDICPACQPIVTRLEGELS